MLELMVIAIRLLLPFTHGIDGAAITAALVLAQRAEATLVLLSLLHQAQTPGKRGLRLPDIEQSRDFLAFVQHKAARAGVPVERLEVYTGDPVRSIRAIAQEMECAGIILCVRRGTGVLLATSEVKQLLEDEHIPLYLVLLRSKGSAFSLLRWFARWLGR